jgi:uncharacterized membrane protein
MDPILGQSVLRFLGRLHVLVVHFPIALLMVAAMLEYIGSWRHNAPWRHAGFLCLVLGSSSAIIAVVLGLINAEQEPHAARLQDAIDRHMWYGIATTVVCVITVIGGMRMRVRERAVVARRAYRAGLVLICIGVTLSGHVGGELVYGEDYLSAVWDATPTEQEPATTTAESTPDYEEAPSPLADPPIPAIDFATMIQPVFDARCAGCHGADRPAAGLRLDAVEHLFEGDEEFWSVRPSDANSSSLYQRISLPADSPDLMPADGDGPLAPEHIELIRKWIEAGAPRSAAAPAEPQRKPTDFAHIGAAPDSSAESAALARLQQRGATAARIANNTHAIEVNFSTAHNVSDEDIGLLAGLEHTLVWLDLAGTGITNSAMAEVSRFANLEKLRIERTPVGDAGLPPLLDLDRLSYLNLFDTAVTDAGLQHLESMDSLRKLYLWSTATTADGRARLQAALPQVVLTDGLTELSTAPNP